MSNASSEFLPPHVSKAPAPSNNLGIAGFVCSLVGLVSCGLLAPIGLLLSFLGMFKRPRGLAIAGFILGLLGSAWVIVAVFVIGLGTILAAVGVAASAPYIVTSSEQADIAEAIEAYKQANGNYPSSLTLLGLDTETLTDMWGATYRYLPEPDGSGYRIISNGPDGLPDTSDDIPFTLTWESDDDEDAESSAESAATPAVDDGTDPDFDPASEPDAP